MSTEMPLVLFTDGFCDEEDGHVRAGVGAVLFDPRDNAAEAFGMYVPECLVEIFKHKPDAVQVVGQAEILPLIIARWRWRERFLGRKVLNFIDNDAARFGLIKGYSPSLASAWLLWTFWEQEASLQTANWFARVPTQSNCADGPSRLSFGALEHLWKGGVTKVPPPPSVPELVRRRVEAGIWRDAATS